MTAPLQLPGPSPRSLGRGGCPLRPILNVAIILALVFTGCTNRDGADTPPNKPGVDQSAVLAEMLAWTPPGGAEPATAPAVEPKPEPESPSGKNLLANPSFEARDPDGRPKGWVVSPLDSILPSSEAGADAYDGAESLTLRGHATNWTVVSMSGRLIQQDLGKKLVASAWGKVTAPDAMYLSIAGTTAAGSQEFVRKSWPVSKEQWTELTVEAIVPADADPATVRLIVSVRNNPEILARLDQIQLRFAE